MDRSRFKRPGTKKPSQIQTNNTFENLPPAQRIPLTQPQNLTSNFQSNGISKLALRGLRKVIDDKSISNISNKPKETLPAKIALLARRSPMDMSLPGDESPLHLNEYIKKTKWHRLRIVATTGLAVSLIVVMTLGGLIFSENYVKLHKVFRGTANADSLSSPDGGLNGQSTGRINVLLLGRDGADTKYPDVTDTMVVASIDVVNNNITFVSLPNNLWVNNSDGAMPLSNVFEKGEFVYQGGKTPGSTDTKTIDAGFSLADQSVSAVLGIPIDYNSIINFAGLEQIVNTVGGISINVPSALVDPTMAWQNGGQATLAQAGTQTLTGQQALLYAMSKETTSETSREERQRAVISAIFTKMMTNNILSSPDKISDLLTSFGNNLATDLSINNALKLYKLVAPISSGSLTSIDLFANNSQYIMNGNMEGQAMVLPSAGLFNYGQIKAYIATQLPNPYLVKEDAGILVLNGTSTPGLATNLGNWLSSEGYNVSGVANTSNPGWAKTTLYNVAGGNLHTQSFLEKSLKLKVSNKPLNKSIATDGADFVIIIGNNEANNP